MPESAVTIPKEHRNSVSVALDRDEVEGAVVVDIGTEHLAGPDGCDRVVRTRAELSGAGSQKYGDETLHLWLAGCYRQIRTSIAVEVAAHHALCRSRSRVGDGCEVDLRCRDSHGAEREKKNCEDVAHRTLLVGVCSWNVESCRGLPEIRRISVSPRGRARGKRPWAASNQCTFTVIALVAVPLYISTATTAMRC